MNKPERHIDDVFSVARDVHPKQPLYSTADLRAIVEQTPSSVAAVPRTAAKARTYLAVGLLAASIATGVFLWPPSPTEPLPELTELVQPATTPATQHPEVREQPHKDVAKSTLEHVPILPATQLLAQQQVGTRVLPPTPLATSSPLASPSKIRGLRFIELSDSDMEKLGIIRTALGYELYTEDIIRYEDSEIRQRMAAIRNDHKISVRLSKSRFKEWYASEFGGDTTQPFAIIKHRVVLDTFTTDGEALRYPFAQCIKPVVSPLIISHDYYHSTDNHGKTVATFENPLLLDSTSKLNHQVFEMYNVFAPDSVVECRDVTKYSLLAKLVPIYIRMGAPKSVKQTTPGSDIILWYYPTPEFLDALPEQIANRLRIELGFTTLVEEGVLHAEELKRRYCGEYNYLDVCRVKDGALSITSVVPNPASERATVKVHVTERRNFTVSLHDMFGNRVAHISNLQLADSDEIAIDVADKPAGTYLIAITSDKGEQVVERLIVSH